MNFSCYQRKGKSKGSADGERGQTDRQTQIMHGSPQPHAHPSPVRLPGAWLEALGMVQRPGAIGAHPSLPTASRGSRPVSHLPHPKSSILYPTACIQCPIFLAHIPQQHPTSHIMHPITCTLPPTPYVLHPMPVQLYPHPSWATYPAERQLDDVGPVAGDDPWEKEEKKEVRQGGLTQDVSPTLLLSLGCCLVGGHKPQEKATTMEQGA